MYGGGWRPGRLQEEEEEEEKQEEGRAEEGRVAVPPVSQAARGGSRECHALGGHRCNRKRLGAAQ